MGVDTKTNKKQDAGMSAAGVLFIKPALFTFGVLKWQETGLVINVLCGVNKWQSPAKVTLNLKLSPAGGFRLQKNHLLEDDNRKGKKKSK